MKLMDKVCLTTFVYGERYISYIPFLVYSCTKSYPDYDIKIFVYGEMSNDINEQLGFIENKSNVEIIENAYSDFKSMTPLISKTLRWLLWDDSFKSYDYLYTVDIDMLYMSEPIPLHEQHKEHMNTLSLPFSNIKREREFSFLKFYDLAKAYKELGISHTLRCFGKTSVEYKLTGLHFVKIDEYYSSENLKIINSALKDLKEGRFIDGVYFPNNEIFLFKLVEKMGCNMHQVPIQQNAVDMLSPENPSRLEFRPHHGIHLGCLIDEKTLVASESTFSSEVYHHYANTFQRTMLTDQTFRKLLNRAPDYIKGMFERLFRYYGIEY